MFCVYTQYNNMNLHSSQLNFPLGDIDSACCITSAVALPQTWFHLLHEQFKSKFAIRED